MSLNGDIPRAQSSPSFAVGGQPPEEKTEGTSHEVPGTMLGGHVVSQGALPHSTSPDLSNMDLDKLINFFENMPDPTPLVGSSGSESTQKPNKETTTEKQQGSYDFNTLDELLGMFGSPESNQAPNKETHTETQQGSSESHQEGVNDTFKDTSLENKEASRGAGNVSDETRPKLTRQARFRRVSDEPSPKLTRQPITRQARFRRVSYETRPKLTRQRSITTDEANRAFQALQTNSEQRGTNALLSGTPRNGGVTFNPVEMEATHLQANALNGSAKAESTTASKDEEVNAKDKSERVCNEIKDTEKSYYDGLYKLMQCADKMKKSKNNKIQDFGEEINTLLKPLLTSAANFNECLGAAIKQPVNLISVRGEAVLNVYIAEGRRYLRVIGEFVAKTESLNEKLKELQAKYPREMDKMNLSDGFGADQYIILPTQRGPRHELLLKDLGESMSKVDEPDAKEVGKKVLKQVGFIQKLNTGIQAGLEQKVSKLDGVTYDSKGRIKGLNSGKITELSETDFKNLLKQIEKLGEIVILTGKSITDSVTYSNFSSLLNTFLDCLDTLSTAKMGSENRTLVAELKEKFLVDNRKVLATMNWKYFDEAYPAKNVEDFIVSVTLDTSGRQLIRNEHDTIYDFCNRALKGVKAADEVEKAETSPEADQPIVHKITSNFEVVVHGAKEDMLSANLDYAINPANKDNRPGGGLAGKIFKAIGKTAQKARAKAIQKFKDEHRTVKNPMGNMKVGKEVVIYGAGDLCKTDEKGNRTGGIGKIINVAGPDFRKLLGLWKTKESKHGIELLKSSYKESVKAAIEDAKKEGKDPITIGLPAISGKIFGGDYNKKDENGLTLFDHVLAGLKDLAEERGDETPKVKLEFFPFENAAPFRQGVEKMKAKEKDAREWQAAL